MKPTSSEEVYMAWLGIWYEHEARQGGPLDPRQFTSLVHPVIYPYAHSFVENETSRLEGTEDPSRTRKGGELHSVYYSLNHDGGQGGLHQQGCSILQWLFQNFEPGGNSTISKRFCEIPVIIHAVNPARAAAMANALTLLRFLAREEDQAVAKIMLNPWDPSQRPDNSTAALEYEKRCIEFLNGDIFYPENVSLFDVLGRIDLKSQRSIEPCCKTQIGFIESLLKWADECWPQSQAEAVELETKMRDSLADEAAYHRRQQLKKQASLEREALLAL
jgi:hypothetical protein